MYRLVYLTVIFFCLLTVPYPVQSEVIQLLDESIENKRDSSFTYSVSQLKEIQLTKNTIVKFIDEPSDKKQELCSSKYQQSQKNIEARLSDVFNKESYSKIDFRKIEYINPNHINVKIHLYWEDEGYSGLQTFYFIMINESGGWKIDWIVY